MDADVLKHKKVKLTFLTHMLNLTSDITWWFLYHEDNRLYATMRLFSNHGGLDDYDKIKMYASKLSHLTIRGYKNIEK